MIRQYSIANKAKSASIKQPKELLTYNRDLDGNYVYGADEFTYYYFPDAYIDKSFDLKGGFSNFKKIPEEENIGDFQSILNGIVKYEQAHGKIDSDIISFRGIMTKLMTLHTLKEPFKLKLITYDGHIMIKNDDEFELNKRKSTPTSEYQQKCEYSGYKFEKLVMLPKPWPECTRKMIENRHKAQVNNYEQTISVVKTSIGKTKLLLAGEVDGIFDYKPEHNNLSHYIELKTNKLIYNENQAKNFETKLYKTWVQCFLLGIKKIGVGFRDDNLLLKNIELYETDEVPLLLKDKINCMTSLKFFAGLMEWFNELDKSKNASYSVSFDNDHVVVLESQESFEKEFLSEEFVSWRDSLRV